MSDYARGGYIKPRTDQDTVPLVLSEGCAYIITPAAARRYGADTLEALNRQAESDEL